MFILLFPIQCDDISGNSNTPPVDNYTVCINAICQLIVTDNCSTSVPVKCNTMYTANVTLNNRVGPSNPSSSSNISKSIYHMNYNYISFYNIIDTDLLRDVRVTDISNISANISYSTYQGCAYFPPDIKVQLILVNENTSDTVLMDSKSYVTNHTDSFNPPSLYPNTVYNYTLQVFVGADINSGMKICINKIGRFMTSETGDMGGDTGKKTYEFLISIFSY